MYASYQMDIDAPLVLLNTIITSVARFDDKMYILYT